MMIALIIIGVLRTILKEFAKKLEEVKRSRQKLKSVIILTIVMNRIGIT